MNKFHFVILLLLVLGTTLIQGKKEEKNAIAKANTNILELIQLFKSLLNQALSKADLSSSVRGVLSSPLSIGATAVSVLLGGIVLMAFYESPLSPLPVPPLPQAPVGRFPPENPIVRPMNQQQPQQNHGGSHIQHRLYKDPSAMHFLNPEQFRFHDHRRMLYEPLNQQTSLLKGQLGNSNYPNIKRSSTGDTAFSYINQMAKNNLKPSGVDAKAYHRVYETPLFDLASSPSSAQVNQLRKDAPSKSDNSNLQASASSGHAAFAAPPNDKNANSNVNNFNKNSNNLNNLNNLNTANNQLNNQLNVQQSDPVYRPDDENRSNEKVSLDHYAIKDAIKEQDFDQKQLVHSQLSQIEFKTPPELELVVENLKRSAE